ncbi:GNAT family N-acetyltransferase [Aeromonas allosaccharophila]|uniref:GNAT family N-acetyltransferase n=1 Tax=Aeromonas allosaccharophila TaxID=656 RepID=UPI000DCF6E41|nr:GNAT family N-acetyltransferase [Aeromonas allosaccharophila]
MKPALSIKNEGLLLRPLNEKDLGDTLYWRNRDGVRQFFFYDKLINMDEHYRWYENYLGKDTDVVLIGESLGEKIGQLAVYDIDLNNGKAEIGRFVVSPDFAGKGMMRRLIILLCDACAAYGLKELYLEVLPSNERAIRLYDSIGFTIIDKTPNAIKMSKVLGV